MEYGPIIAAGVSALASGAAGLFVWGLKAEVAALRTEIRASLAETENRFFQRVNGNYVRKELYGDLTARVDRIESRVDDLE
jgi:hypothetical protein